MVIVHDYMINLTLDYSIYTERGTLPFFRLVIILGHYPPAIGFNKVIVTFSYNGVSLSTQQSPMA